MMKFLIIFYIDLLSGCTGNLPEEEKQKCGKNSDECKICRGDKCNSKPLFERCVNCDSKRHAGCADSTSELRTKICTDYDDQCFTRIGNFGVRRGCLNEQKYDFQNQCRNYKRKCFTCNAHNDSQDKDFVCNNQTIKMEYCAQCDSKNDENCRDNAELYTNKICSQFNSVGGIGDREGCYMLEVCDDIFQFIYKMSV